MPSQVLNILVEGDTEGVVLKDFLKPYWDKRFSKCVVANYHGSGNLKGKYVREAERILSEPDQAVLVLFDIKNDPFGVQSSSSTHADAYETLQTRLYSGAGMRESDVLGIFPVVIEPETWLLADPTIQKTYLNKTHTHPENEQNPADIIHSKIKGYHKGVSTKKIFAKASAEAVYADNCPHFVLLANWIVGKESTSDKHFTGGLSPDMQQQLQDLQRKYNDLTHKIEMNIKRGQTAAAGILKAEQNDIEKQIRDINLRSSKHESDHE